MNMELKAFVIAQIKELATAFKDAKFRYEIDQESDHLIEVTPASLLNESEDFHSAIAKLIDEFNKIDANHDLVFLSPGDLVEIENPIFVYSAPTELNINVEVLGGKTEQYYTTKKYLSNVTVRSNVEVSQKPPRENDDSCLGIAA